MKVDFHVRLQEGSHSLEWLQRTAQSLQPLVSSQPSGSPGWAQALARKLAERIGGGAYNREWLELYRHRAKGSGVQVVGVVEHLYRFVEFRDLYAAHVQLGGDRVGLLQRRWLDQVSCESLSAYVLFMEEEQRRWAEDGIALKIGIALDFFAGAEDELSRVIRAYPWDFCLGKVRFVDGRGLHLPDVRERFAQRGRSGSYSDYFDLVEQAVESGLFDLLADVDGLRYFGGMADQTSFLRYYQRLARALKRHDVAVEIQPFGAVVPFRKPSNGYVLLEILAQHKVAVTVASGACYPEQLGQHWEEASEVLKRAGIDSIAVYDRRVRQTLPLGQRIV
ncbi:histidinol phosphate phosphatase domain-containing protein [Brevibacillus sp. TJ4]|uniref:histidinol phosphate phosphatase domain-containing protein n=1 Tax=Brevibacillus sp. TJ4 TaxID=3234853 RepID=UPI0037D27396